MSEITRGVIGMPFDLAMGSEMSRRQFHSIAQELLAEIERLRTAEGDAMTYKAGMENVAQQRDQLKAENDRLERNRDMWKAQVERQAEELTALRKDAERLVFCTSHPEQQFFQGESGWGVMDCADGLSIPFKDADSLRSAIDRVMGSKAANDQAG